MTGDFDHILARKTAGRAHHGQQNFVQDAALPDYFAEMNGVRGRGGRGRRSFAGGPETGVGNGERLRAGKADNGNSALAHGGGDGGDGVVEVKVQILRWTR